MGSSMDWITVDKVKWQKGDIIAVRSMDGMVTKCIGVVERWEALEEDGQGQAKRKFIFSKLLTQKYQSTWWVTTHIAIYKKHGTYDEQQLDALIVGLKL